MKFRFCGDQDCPDWFLAEIEILSRLSSVKMKLLSQHVVQQLLGKEFKTEKALQLTADAKIGEKDLESLLAALCFILHSAARFAVPEHHLSAELQQVGLPREHAAAVAKVYNDSFSGLRQKLIENTLRVNRLENVNYEIVQREMETWVKLQLSIKKTADSPPEQLEFMCEPAQLHVLLHDLYRIRQIMESVGLQSETSSST